MVLKKEKVKTMFKFSYENLVERVITRLSIISDNTRNHAELIDEFIEELRDEETDRKAQVEAAKEGSRSWYNG
jgi:hypothetical protein